jgi:hypothetical protein
MLLQVIRKMVWGGSLRFTGLGRRLRANSSGEQPMYVIHRQPADIIGDNASRGASPERLPMRVCRRMVDGWMRRIERQTEEAVRQLDHAGLLEEFRASRRG